jgi:hypothetical protein
MIREARMAQLGFFDAEKRLAALSAKGDPLEAIDRLVPWESFRADIEAVVLTPDETRKSNSGRKPVDAIVMLRMLVLQCPAQSFGRASGISGARPAVIYAVSAAGPRGRHSGCDDVVAVSGETRQG